MKDIIITILIIIQIMILLGQIFSLVMATTKHKGEYTIYNDIAMLSGIPIIIIMGIVIILSHGV